MSEEKAQYSLAVRDQVLFPTWGQMREQADVLRKSGFFPKSIKSAEQALAVMMMGRELGIGTMESVRSIYPIEGKPTASAALMGALILRSGASYVIDESTNERCVITFKRRTGETYTHTFTIQDAQAAKLTGKGAWVGYKKAMLYNRCMSAGARAFMPNVIMNLYTPEELGAPVIIEGGDVVIDAEAVVVEDAPIELDVEKPEPEAEPPTNGDAWIKDKVQRDAFTDWLHNERGLRNDQLLEALRVSSMRGWRKPLEETKQIIMDWAAGQAMAETTQGELV